jgi:hypothetical protein
MSDDRSPRASDGGEVGDAIPPPPSPLPDAVACVAAGLLIAPECAGPAGLPVVAGYRRAFELHERLVNESPNVPAHWNELGRTSSSLAELLLEAGRSADAREYAERAVRHQQAALNLLPKHPAYGRHLARHYRVLAEALVRLGDHAAAVKAAAETPRPSDPDEGADRFWAGILARCISLAQKDSTLVVDKREATAKAYGDQAIALLRQGFQGGSRPSLAQLKADPNLAPLRPRADFQRLVKDLEKASGSGDR